MENLERGERGGVVLDKGTGDDVPGGSDVETKADKEIIETVDEQGGATNPDGGAEVPQDGEDVGQEEGIPAEESPESGVQKSPDLESFKAEMKAEIAKLIPQEAPKKMTDEEWQALEQQTGTPRSAIEFHTNQVVKAVNKVMDYIDQKLSKYEVGDAINSFSKDPKFSDATRYRNDINEFLSDYDPKHWSNPALLEKALYYARGKNANANARRFASDGERNRRIAGAARPAAPAGGARRVAAPALTPTQREAAELMGGESEYRKFQSRPSRTLE